VSDLWTGLRISKVTLFSLLLGLLLACGIRLWYVERKDECARWLAGDRSAPATQTVVSGTRTIEVPCTDWAMRQPLGVQVLCLLDMALGVVFVMNGLADVREWMQVRRGNS
jgi:hypothetical protein